MKNIALHRLQKRLVYSVRAETGKQSLVSTSAEDIHVGQLKFFAVLCRSKNDSESTTINFRVRNKFCQVGEFTKEIHEHE